MNEVMNIGGVDCYEKDGTAYLKLEAVARGLGFTQIAASGNEVVRWERVRKYLSELSIPTSGDGAELPDFIPENIFYRLAMKAKNETAERFQALVADEIIPSIRKTGGYGIEKKTFPLSIEHAFRLTELINDTPPEKQPIIRVVFSQAGVHIPETAGYAGDTQNGYDDNPSVSRFLAWADVVNRPTNDVYLEYVEYCSEHRCEPVSNIVFSKMANRILGLKVVDKKINGKKRRVFVC